MARRNRLGLTRSQHACVRLYVAGFSDKEVARKLGRSHATVGTHLDNARFAMGVASRRELFREVLRRAGVVDVSALVDKAAGV